MSDISDALAQLKVLVATVDASPNPNLDSRIWVYPTENTAIDNTTYPFAIIKQHLISIDKLLQPTMGGGSFRHSWKAEVIIFLGNSPTYDVILQGELETLQHTWYTAMGKALYADLSLSGNVDQIGPQIDIVTTDLVWSDSFTGWGMRFVFDVITTIIV